MLNKKQISEIREHLEKSQNPLFFFDNDVDGLCSFLLLQRFSNKGKGVAIKSFPDLSIDYFRKVNELNADSIFVLDKSLISEEFLEEVEKHNLPLIIIDHHKTEKKLPEFVNHYNPSLNGNLDNAPTTYLCYQVSGKKEDAWLAVVGCIADHFIPEVYPEIREKYPELTIDSNKPFEIKYKSQIGKITNILGFALMDRTTNVLNMMRFLMKVKTPYEILHESNDNQTIHYRFNQINKKYQNLLSKAKTINSNNQKLLFFQYSGDLSISSDLSNELSFSFPDKFIVVAYLSGVKVNISVRGKRAKEITLKAIKGFDNSAGGGHEEAVGAKVQAKDLEEFKKRVEKLLE